MSQYYFTIASLPALLYTHRPILNEEDFLDTCRQTLSPADFNLLRRAVINDPYQASSHLPFLRRWRDWEITLRTTLAGLRAKAKGLPVPERSESFTEDFEARQTAVMAYNAESPLKADEIMETARWELLSTQEVSHHFDLPWLCIYYLKLQMLLRKYTFDSARGEQKYSGIIQEYLDLLKTRENTYVK